MRQTIPYAAIGFVASLGATGFGATGLGAMDFGAMDSGASTAHGPEARPNEARSTNEDAMKVRIIVEGTELAATLEDSAASRDFAAQLPLDLTLEDYHATEKIADLPARLSTEGAPEGVDPDVGDITYFAPWGNLALFYRDFGYARGLVRLGRIDGSVEVLEQDGPLAARIERIEEPE